MKEFIYIGIILLMILISGCIEMRSCGSYFTEENPVQNCIHRRCYDKCHSVGHKYFMWEDSLGGSECWCLKNDNTTIQVY